MKKISALLVLSILILAGCNSNASKPCENGNSDVTMVTDKGGINDKSFNQGTWEGIERYCADNKIGATFIESTEESQYISNLTAAAERSKVVVAAGFNFEKAITGVAQKNPETKFILIDATPKDSKGNEILLDNVKTYFFDETQGGYLAGYVAGKTTKTNKVGFMGGLEIPPVQKFGWGFLQGVQDANDKATVEYNYTGTFGEPALGKTTAETMYAKGVDVIFTAAGGTNTGAIGVAKTLVTNGKDAWIIGVDKDYYNEGIYEGEKSVILTSALKSVGTASYEGIELALGNWDNSTSVLTFANKGIALPEVNPNLDDKLVKEAKDALEAKKDLIGTDSASVKKVITIKVNGKI